ncbi:MAG: glycosyltransferase family 4 protein [Microthrixaceae bacterium]
MSRITLVVNQFETGSETFLRRLATSLSEEGHRVTQYSLLAARTAQQSQPGLAQALPAAQSAKFPLAAARLAARSTRATTTAISRATSQFGRTPRAAKTALQLAPLLATEPDVVHVSFSGIAVALADALPLLDPKTRVIVSCRGSGELVRPVLYPEQVEALRTVLQGCDCVHAVSEAVSTALVNMGVSQELISVIRPGVDVEEFSRTSPYLPISTDTPVRIISVGRLHWVKDIATTLSAFAELRSRGFSAELTIVGDGEEREALQFRAAVLGIQDTVTFTGALSPKQVREQLEQSQLFVLSSLSEGTSNAALEAMALQIPVIVTGVGGMVEVIENGVNGWVVPPSNPAKLAQSMISSVTNSSLAEELGRAGRASLDKGLTLELQRTAIRQMYRELL